jgi:hypothetical protein
MALINLIPTVKLVDCSAGRRLQRNQRDSRDPAGALHCPPNVGHAIQH